MAYVRRASTAPSGPNGVPPFGVRCGIVGTRGKTLVPQCRYCRHTGPRRRREALIEECQGGAAPDTRGGLGQGYGSGPHLLSGRTTGTTIGNGRRTQSKGPTPIFLVGCAHHETHDQAFKPNVLLWPLRKTPWLLVGEIADRYPWTIAPFQSWQGTSRQSHC